MTLLVNRWEQPLFSFPDLIFFFCLAHTSATYFGLSQFTSYSCYVLIFLFISLQSFFSWFC